MELFHVLLRSAMLLQSHENELPDSQPFQQQSCLICLHEGT